MAEVITTAIYEFAFHKRPQVVLTLATLPCIKALEMFFEREVWHHATADWEASEEALRATEWRPLCDGTAEDVLAHFQKVLWVFFN